MEGFDAALKSLDNSRRVGWAKAYSAEADLEKARNHIGVLEGFVTDMRELILGLLNADRADVAAWVLGFKKAEKEGPDGSFVSLIDDAGRVASGSSSYAAGVKRLIALYQADHRHELDVKLKIALDALRDVRDGTGFAEIGEHAYGAGRALAEIEGQWPDGTPWFGALLPRWLPDLGRCALSCLLDPASRGGFADVEAAQHPLGWRSRRDPAGLEPQLPDDAMLVIVVTHSLVAPVAG